MSLDRPIDVADGSVLHIPMEGMIVEEKIEEKMNTATGGMLGGGFPGL